MSLMISKGREEVIHNKRETRRKEEDGLTINIKVYEEMKIV